MSSGKASTQRRRATQAPPPVRVKALCGRSSSSLKNVPAVGSLTAALRGAADVEALFKGVPSTERRSLGEGSHDDDGVHRPPVPLLLSSRRPTDKPALVHAIESALRA